MEGIKGKHFFIESDIKGPALKLDNTGKAILTVSIRVFQKCDFGVVNFFLNILSNI